jgi:excisionase family DNA binding protein
VLITVSEAARRLDTYPNAINRWIAKGELEAFRVEGRGFRFVDAEQVEALRLALVGLAERGDAFRVGRVGTPRSSGL